jgi:hypothetical protein
MMVEVGRIADDVDIAIQIICIFLQHPFEFIDQLGKRGPFHRFTRPTFAHYFITGNK